MNTIKCSIVFALLVGTMSFQRLTAQSVYQEPHRPQIHFSPKDNWMNDPNGMVFHQGTYHLFYQHYPDKPVWGPMHWAHATSTDLVHWQHQPIALYPDSLGYIFSGSAVFDEKNTSGFGQNGKAPLVAVFTHHDTVGEKAGRNDFENQSLAYSIDDGKTWIKYAGNPVLKSPGIRDFRDPKVMWHEATEKWIMTIAAQDRIMFYSSPDLKRWTSESEFGKDAGAHGGVWECPDLFQLEHKGKKVWVLIVNINPGGPNGGSATQYFLGDFDGKSFSALHNDTRWLDYGPDEYAGVTWSNTGKRKIFFGWMSNWAYANIVPTEKWRSAGTVPRELGLRAVGDSLYVSSMPVDELKKIETGSKTIKNIKGRQSTEIASGASGERIPCRIDMTQNKAASFELVLSNEQGEKVVVGYDKSSNSYYLDRSSSGKTAFHKDFAARHTAPRLSTAQKLNVTLIIDVSSVELFADDGLTVMTQIFFPNQPYSSIAISQEEKGVINHLQYAGMKSIWK